jgi:hypothetical protein
MASARDVDVDVGLLRDEGARVDAAGGGGRGRGGGGG